MLNKYRCKCTHFLRGGGGEGELGGGEGALLFSLSFLYFGSDFNKKKIILLAFVRYEIIILSQRSASERRVGYLPSHVQRGLVE